MNGKCDRCWKEFESEEDIVIVDTGRPLKARFCKECAELTGNARSC